MRFSSTVRQLIISGLFIFITSSILPCEYNIRDAGFVEISDRPFSILYFIDDTVSSEALDRFSDTIEELNGIANITGRTIQLKHAHNDPAQDYFNLWIKDSIPALVLVSPDQRSMRLGSGAIRSSQKLYLLLESVKTSQLRREILSRIVDAYAVILLVEGNDPAQNSMARSKIETAGGRIAAAMQQLPKRINHPPQLLVLPAASQPEEAILLWSLGIEVNRSEQPTIALIFGRGRTLLTPFRHSQISESQLFDLLSILGLSCDCSLEKDNLIGRQFPLVWDATLRSRVVKQLGFDAENPLLKREIAGILSLRGENTATFSENSETIIRSLSQLKLYEEGTVSLSPAATAPRISPAGRRKLTEPETVTNRSELTVVVCAGFGLLLFILACGTFLYWRAKRREK